METPAPQGGNCPDGNARTYANTTCDHPGVTYTFPPLAGFFHSEGTAHIEPEEIQIIQDRSGPNTLLISSPQFFVSRAGESVIVRLTWHVDRSNAYAGFLNRAEISGDASARATMTVNSDPPMQIVSTPEAPQDYSEKYSPGPYRVELLLELKSNGGTATFGSYGAHFGVLA